MTCSTRTDHYPATSKLLHWLVAACVTITAPVAIAMTRIDKGPTRDALYNLHTSIGVLIPTFDGSTSFNLMKGLPWSRQ